MPELVCPKCSKELMPKENGIYVEEHADDGGRYRIWHADLYKCPVCPVEIICNFGRTPTADYYLSPGEYENERRRVTHHFG